MNRIMMPLLGFVLLFVELYLLIRFGVVFGGLAVLIEVLGTGFLGYWLMRFVGRTAFQPAQLIGLFLHGLAPGVSSRRPVEWLLLGSLLLIIPGILTDLVGLLLIARYFMRGGTRGASSSDSNSIDIEFDVQDDTEPKESQR